MTKVSKCDKVIIEKEKERKKMFEEKMDKVIKKYGFEAKETIAFCKKCEEVEKEFNETHDWFKARILTSLYQELMEK